MRETPLTRQKSNWLKFLSDYNMMDSDLVHQSTWRESNFSNGSEAMWTDPVLPHRLSQRVQGEKKLHIVIDCLQSLTFD